MEGTIFLIAWSCLVIFMTYKMFKGGKEALSIFPNVDDSNFIYIDKSASGNSNKSLITKFGGANKTLHVMVNNEELWIKSSLFFAYIGRYYDLIHRIPLNQITSSVLNHNIITIKFNTENGKQKSISLRTKNNQELAKILSK